MRDITTVAEIPPMIMQRFNKELLSVGPGFKKKGEYIEIYDRAKDKCKGIKLKEFELLLQLMDDLHEWKKAEDAEFKETKKAVKKVPVALYDKCVRIRGKLGKVFKEFFDGYEIV